MPALFVVFLTNRSIIGSTLLLDIWLLLLVVVENCSVIISRHRGRLGFYSVKSTSYLLLVTCVSSFASLDIILDIIKNDERTSIGDPFP